MVEVIDVISIVPFANNVETFASTLKGLQRRLDVVTTFGDLQEFMVNLGKTNGNHLQYSKKMLFKVSLLL